jgi:SAM-dependent methyltransferase
VTAYLYPDTDRIGEQLGYLQTTLDPISTAALDEIGVTDGWRCLEVGAGAGSIALWLADRVAPGGTVTATDIRPHLIAPRDNLTVLEHDITRDELRPATYDLVHARLVLMHLPEREAVLARLVEALRPGGWLVLDEFDCTYLPVHSGDAVLFDKINGIMLGLVAARGADLSWGARAYGAMHRAGLVEVASTSAATVWRGGEPGCLLHQTHSYQIEPDLLAAGVTREELRRFREMMLDPQFAVNSYLLVSTCGRRPG